VTAGRDRQLNKENNMDWIYGFLAGLAIFGGFFVMVCNADKPADEEDSKTLMGALD
jgi:hypothetical protein